MKVAVKTRSSRMGIVTSRISRWGNVKVAYFLPILLLVVTLGLSLLPTKTASAASYFDKGNKWNYITPDHIKTNPFQNIDFYDSNVSDYDPTYVGQATGGTPDVYKNRCSNYNGDPNSIWQLTLTSRSQGILKEYDYPSNGNKHNCQIITTTITLDNPDKGPDVKAPPTFNPNVPTSAGWQNDATITANGSEYRDANPYDNNRTFKDTPSGWYCNNGLVNTLIANTPTKGTIYYITTPPPANISDKVECVYQIGDITLYNQDAGKNYETPCDGNANQFQHCIDQRAAGNAAWVGGCTNVDPASAQDGTLCSPSGSDSPAPSPHNPVNDGTTNGDGNAPSDCDSIGGFSFRWAFCPILTASMSLVTWLDETIQDNLHFDMNRFDRNTDAGKGMYGAYAAMRNIALVIILGTGLLIVFSQGTSLQLFNALFIKQAAPKFGLGVAGVIFGWPLLQFTSGFSNDLTSIAGDIILAPFQAVAHTTTSASGGLAETGVITGVALTSFLGAGAYLLVIGPIGIMSLLGTLLLVLLLAFCILEAIDIAHILFVVVWPIAMALGITDFGKRVSGFVTKGYTGVLLLGPALGGTFACIYAVVLITPSGPGKIIVVIAGLTLPLAVARAVLGGMSILINGFTDRGKGLMGKLSQARSNSAKTRAEDALQGRGNNWLGKGWTGAAFQNTYGRMKYANEGGLSVTRMGRSRYQAQRQRVQDQVAAKMLEQDHGRAAGDDDATRLALQEGMTKARFLKALSEGVTDANGNTVIKGRGAQGARDALATLENSFGARVGSDGMRVAAFKARAASNTGYSGENQYKEMTQDAAGMVASGLMTQSDAVATLKSNKMRSDMAGVGFSAWMSALGTAVQNYGNGARFDSYTQQDVRGRDGAQLITEGTITGLRRDALSGTPTGQLLGGRHEAVTALMPQLRDDAIAAQQIENRHVQYVAEQQRLGTWTTEQQGQAERLTQVLHQETLQKAAQFLNLSDQAGSSSILIGSKVAAEKERMIVGPDGREQTLTQWSENMRKDPGVLAFRREYQYPEMDPSSRGVPPPGAEPH